MMLVAAPVCDASAIFLIGLAHTGIRIGRKTYLVDMAPADRRASYVAVSNTLIGVVLLAFGAVGLLAPLLGARGVVLLVSALGLAGGLLAWTMRGPPVLTRMDFAPMCAAPSSGMPRSVSPTIPIRKVNGVLPICMLSTRRSIHQAHLEV